VATEQDAARDRVLAARAELAEQVDLLEASGRAAIDIPARIKRSPARAAAIVGGVGFLALKGPQRLFGLARRGIRGGPAPLPKSMLPEEVEKTLRKLGSDGDKVRGTLERDFAGYVKKAQKDRRGVMTVLLLTTGRPLLTRAAKFAADALFTPNQDGVAARLAQVRARATEGADEAREGVAGARASAQERIAAVRRDEGEPEPAEKADGT
jgi:hypothetical protein